MCGIAGIFEVREINDAAHRVQLMIKAMEHRGPDAGNVVVNGNAVFGHRRLSIIDLNENSNQPFLSRDGRYSLTFNGEIYNYIELRSRLQDFDFQTESDTEVLLAALIKWGAKALQLLNGMFAFAFWDTEKNELLIARDRLGIKPLYYAEVNNSIVFGSEVRGILASELVPRKLNHKCLNEYLQYQSVSAPNTLVFGVKMLDSATYMSVNNDGLEKVEYWKPWQNKHFDDDSFVVKKIIQEKLTASVESRLNSDVPFGAFLSGGIDSSLLVGIASEHLGRKIDTFNVSFDESKFSEATYARTVAEKFGANHHEIKLTPQTFLSSLPEAVGNIDHPSGDGLNSWIVSRETKNQGISMALSGLGGDEVFAGYDVFKRIPEISNQDWLLSFPMFLRRTGAKLLELKNPGISSRKQTEVLTSEYFDLKSLYPIFRKVLLDSQIEKILSKQALNPQNRISKIIDELEVYEDFSRLLVLSRISIAEISTYMQNTLLRDTDQMSMAHGLEVRVPFLDHNLVEYATYISDTIKYPVTPKRLLVESFADLLPEEIVNREKMGFVLPWEYWMRNELRSFCEERIALLAENRWFNERGVIDLWEQFLKGSKYVGWSRIWHLVVLSDWIKKNRIEA